MNAVAKITDKATTTKKKATKKSKKKTNQKYIGSDFTYLIYPDSAPTDWIDRLSKTGRQILISPIHDRDPLFSNEPTENEQELKNFLEEEIKEILNSEDIEPYKTQEFTYERVIPKLNGEDVTEEVQAHFYTNDFNEIFITKKPHYHVVESRLKEVQCDTVRSQIQKAFETTEAVKKIQVVKDLKNMVNYLTHNTDQAIAEGKYQYSKEDLIALNGFDLAKLYKLDKNYLFKIFMDVTPIIHSNECKNIAEFIQIVRYNEILTLEELDQLLIKYGATIERLCRGYFQAHQRNIESQMVKQMKKDEQANRQSINELREQVNILMEKI